MNSTNGHKPGRSFSFVDKRKFSSERVQGSNTETIKSMIPGCVSVEVASLELDLKGIDYIATLKSGRTLNIDAKTRERGCSAFWKNGEPDLALERYSVVPDGCHKGKMGWTLEQPTRLQI